MSAFADRSVDPLSEERRRIKNLLDTDKAQLGDFLRSFVEVSKAKRDFDEAQARYSRAKSEMASADSNLREASRLLEKAEDVHHNVLQQEREARNKFVDEGWSHSEAHAPQFYGLSAVKKIP